MIRWQTNLLRAKRMAINSFAVNKIIFRHRFSRAHDNFLRHLDSIAFARAAEIPSLIEAARRSFSSAKKLLEIVIIGGFNPGFRSPRSANLQVRQGH